MWWQILLVVVIALAAYAASHPEIGERAEAEKKARKAAVLEAASANWMPCPRCGSKRVRYEKLVSGGQRAGMTMAGFFFPVYWIAALAAGARRKEFNCDDCRFEWNRAEAPADAGRIA